MASRITLSEAGFQLLYKKSIFLKVLSKYDPEKNQLATVEGGQWREVLFKMQIFQPQTLEQ